VSGNALQIVSNFTDADISISPDGSQAVAVIAESIVPGAEPGTISTSGSYRIINLESGESLDSKDLEAAGLEWTPFAPRRPADSSALRLEVAEGLNQPPVLVATKTESGESRTVFDPNPQLADIALVPVTVFEWEDQHGRTNIGGLIKPASFEAGRRYPLVIQTHGFSRNRFFRVGYSDTANAGRALASRDMVVLQVREPSGGEDTPINLEEIGLDVYLAAIDELAASGMVDPERVGISGYSFTGITVATSIARAPERFAAAVIANADPLTMTGFYSYVDSPLQGLTEKTLVGTAPFDDGLRVWVDESPTMSASSISAPVLISAADPLHLLSLWDFYSALRYQGKAMELQYIRSGTHNLTKPLHRVAHQETIVDWFDFWLNENQDADPEKVDRYRRWRDLEQRVQ
jgi:dipeptidyl aminopeptidase/acylaminoacyl peptidase